MSHRPRLALALAAFQVADVVVTQVSPRYGDEHLDHLGVPRWLRPFLPTVKAAAAGALVATWRRPTARSLTATVLVSYYSAAVTFHVLAGDGPPAVAPAAACAAMAASIV